MQKRESKWRYPEPYQHGLLAEYCYRLDVEVTSSSKIASVMTAEHIAMVLSALINSGGGVLVIHLVTTAEDISLDTCRKDIVDLITHEEIWIPENVFNDTICSTKNEAENEICFFTNKTSHLVTHNSNAYYFKESNPESIVNKDALMEVIRTCTCVNDTICEKHKDLAEKSQILSTVSSTDTLYANQLFPLLESESDTHIFRNYQLNDRSLPDVMNAQSVQCEILELVSALANTKGGSIFLGVTNRATPTVKGYNLTENDQKYTEHHISDILTGRMPGPVTIWGHSQIESTHYWKTFFHNVVGDDRKVIEIRVNLCPGGMFCALPVCLDIKDTGEIYHLESFPEWRQRVLHGTSSSFRDKPAEQTIGSSQFCWWLSGDGVLTESLRFNQSCVMELADSEMDISTALSTFPPIEAILERFANIERLDDTLKDILHEHQCHHGVAVFIENVADTLPIYAKLKDVTPACHVFDLVILQKNHPPVVVTIFQNESSREVAKKYCLKLGQLLKRGSFKYMGQSNSSMKLCFQCHLYAIGRGCEKLQQEACYPKDYRHPSTETLNTVRYVVARILLDCQQITDRYGNIMVRHLSSFQAKVLLGRRPKVLIVESIAGSGKTVLALEMARRLKRQHGNTRKIVFLCRSRGLAAFVKSQGDIEVLELVIEDNRQCTTELNTKFSRYTDIIVDDAHAIPVFGETTSWTMYNALFSSLQKRPGHAYIFLDPDKQDYRGCIPGDFVAQMEALAGRYVGKHNVQIKPLGKCLRNSGRTSQSTNVDTGMYADELSTTRHILEDGVFFHNIQGKDTSQDATSLLSRLSNLKQYPAEDITILTDNCEDKTWVTQLLKGKYATQDATQFPVKHIVVDTLENFEGLESPVILFVIPKCWGSGYIGSLKYRLCVVARAISRLEFLLPWDASQKQQELAQLKRAFSFSVSTFFCYTICVVEQSGVVRRSSILET